jgi:hypothetical protein
MTSASDDMGYGPVFRGSSRMARRPAAQPGHGPQRRPVSYAVVVGYVYWPGIPMGVLAADDRTTREIQDALRLAERSGDDHALSTARMTLGIALVHRDTSGERDRGNKLGSHPTDAGTAGPVI